MIGSVRAGLCFHLTQSAGWSEIARRERLMGDVARSEWGALENVHVLGPAPRLTPSTSAATTSVAAGLQQQLQRLPIISLCISHPHKPSFLLHWGFVCALLNDLFGIQARGGCLCAGVYAHQLLGISQPEAETLESCLLHNKDELLRPGFVRLSFAYHMSHAEFRFVVDALKWVAQHGHELLALYTPISDTGEWRMNRSIAAGMLDQAYSGMQSQQQRSSQIPREVIRSLCIGDGAGHLSSAARGNTKAHPRRWLQSIKFESRPLQDAAAGGDTGSGVTAGAGAGYGGTTRGLGYSHPNHTIRLACQPGDASSHQRLYSAYFEEANLLLEQVRSTAITGGSAPLVDAYIGPLAPIVAQQDRSALISKQGQQLRWFALAADNLSNAGGSDVIGAPWPLAPRLQQLSCVAGLDAELNPSDRADVTLLATASGHASIVDEELWDGRMPSGATANGAGPFSGNDAASSQQPIKSSARQRPPRQPKQHQQQGIERPMQRSKILGLAASTPAVSSLPSTSRVVTLPSDATTSPSAAVVGEGDLDHGTESSGSADASTPSAVTGSAPLPAPASLASASGAPAAAAATRKVVKAPALAGPEFAARRAQLAVTQRALKAVGMDQVRGDLHS